VCERVNLCLCQSESLESVWLCVCVFLTACIVQITEQHSCCLCYWDDHHQAKMTATLPRMTIISKWFGRSGTIAVINFKSANLCRSAITAARLRPSAILDGLLGFFIRNYLPGMGPKHMCAPAWSTMFRVWTY